MGLFFVVLNWELKMGFPSFLVSFFLVSYLPVLHSSVYSCPSSIECGSHGPIKFPFTNITYSQCGLCTFNCDEGAPKVTLGEEGRSIQVSGIDGDAIKISDPLLEHLITTTSCEFLNYFHPLESGPVSYTISPNRNFFKCPTNSPHHDNFIAYKGCNGYTVYYSYQNDTVPTLGSMPGCWFYQLPVLSSVEDQNPTDPFLLLTSNFSVEYHVSKECQTCFADRSHCMWDNWEFRCLNEKRGRSHLRLILGIVIPGVFLFACLLILIIRYHKKWRNSSSDPFSKEDLEEGSAYFGIPVFSYSELKEATHNFDPSKELGDGGFGTVYHGKLHDGREVAVKRLYQHNYKRVAQFVNEIEILTHLHHPNLVTLYGCTSRHSRELLLVYEYIPNGTVADHLHGDLAKDHPLPWHIRMNIAIETASALVYLHASEIIHRDVKTNNILLDNNFCVKVADFGLSRLFPIDVSHVSTAPQGTPGYVDPDYHQCYQLTDKSDVYSFGVVLIELISSLPAVDISRHRHEINLANLAISRIQDGAFNELIDPALGFNSDSSVERMTTSVAEVAFRCLQLEKEMRPRMNEVLEALKEILEYKDDEIGEMPPPSPDGDNAELLNCCKVPPSQDSVTNGWFSSSTASISSV